MKTALLGIGGVVSAFAAAGVLFFAGYEIHSPPTHVVVRHVTVTSQTFRQQQEQQALQGCQTAASVSGNGPQDLGTCIERVEKAFHG